MKKQLIFGLVLLTLVIFIAGCKKTQTGKAYYKQLEEQGITEIVEIIPGLTIQNRNTIVADPNRVEIKKVDDNKLQYKPRSPEEGYRTETTEKVRVIWVCMCNWGQYDACASMYDPGEGIVWCYPIEGCSGVCWAAPIEMPRLG